MRVLLLSPYPATLIPALEAAGDTLAGHWDDAEYVVSFGHRAIIGEPYLTQFAGRMINLHTSMLPWNRGADPNFWSWFDDTPKGVSIHQIDAGIDTGDVMVSWSAELDRRGTLRSTYDELRRAMIDLFAMEWKYIRAGRYAPQPQAGTGSYHRSRDMPELPDGWDTPVSEVREMGVRHRMEGEFWRQIAERQGWVWSNA